MALRTPAPPTLPDKGRARANMRPVPVFHTRTAP
jgi:hypothetical protein